MPGLRYERNEKINIRPVPRCVRVDSRKEKDGKYGDCGLSESPGRHTGFWGAEKSSIRMKPGNRNMPNLMATLMVRVPRRLCRCVDTVGIS